METCFMDCCAVKELTGIQYDDSPTSTLKELYTGTPYGDCDYKSGRFFVFTQATDRATKYGEKLAALIKRNKLGKVTQCGTGNNPNSENDVTVWVWKMDTEAFVKWAKKKGFERHERDNDLYEDPYYEPGN